MKRLLKFQVEEGIFQISDPVFSGSIKRITEFLNAFSMSCSGRLAALNSKLCLLERKVAFLEAKVEIFDKKKLTQSQGSYFILVGWPRFSHCPGQSFKCSNSTFFGPRSGDFALSEYLCLGQVPSALGTVLPFCTKVMAKGC